MQIKVDRNVETGEVRVTFKNAHDAELVLLAAACRLHDTTTYRRADNDTRKRRALAGACSIASVIAGEDDYNA